MNTHTPGPWIVDDRHVHRQSGLTYPPDSPVNRNALLETDVIVEVDTSCHPNGLLTETDKANLRLIASAPEMLEALKSILLAWSPESGAKLERIVGTTTINLAAAAVRKATQP